MRTGRSTPFGSILTNTRPPFLGGLGLPGNAWEIEYGPRMDLEETEDTWILTAELPGFTADDVSLEIEGRSLRVSGEQKIPERTGRLHLSERTDIVFNRLVRLPSRVDVENCKASFENGILTVRIPRAEEARPRRIKVKAGA